MAYGITSTGFVKKTYAVIKEDFLDGVESGISLLARQAFDSAQAAANKILVIQERIADLWDLAESVYNAWDPDTATGASQDGLYAITGSTRIAAKESSTTLVLKGTVGTTIAAGKQVGTTTLGDAFDTDAAITLSSAACSHAYIDLNGAVATGAYTVTVAGTPYTFNAVAPTHTEADIFSESGVGLAKLITDGAVSATATYTGGQLVVAGDTDAETNLPTPFTVTVTANLQVVEVGNLQAAKSVATGPIVGLATTISNILTPVSGWTAAWNPNDATLGNDEEADAAFRIRRARSLANPGAATVDAIRAAVLALSGVTAAFVISNRTDAVDANGLPAHSFRVLVLGGLSADIADAIWDACDAGDYIDGSVPVTIIDSNGYQQTVRFTRPTEVQMWVQFTVTEDTELGTLPGNYEAQMAAAVATWGALESIGHDSIPAQIAAYVMAQVPGIRTLVTEIVDDAGYPGGFQATPWTIDADELAKYAATRVGFV